MMSDPQQNEQLSPAGLARRDDMLSGLVDVMEREHRVRRLRRRVVVVGGSVCTALLLIALAIPGIPDAPDLPRLVVDKSTDPLPAIEVPAAPRPAVVITSMVTTDPTVVDRFRANPPRLVIRMNDRMLLDALVSIDRPAGLIRFGDDLRISAPVTDAELGL